ncbi:MAG: heme-binding protein [Desulfovibrionaceae bacterium]|nr:heme-binding protein [Desulfovibrionaceae bacterium]
MQNLNLEKAQLAVARAIDSAKSKFNGRPVCVSVCDSYGALLAFCRMDGAPLRSINIAQQKAYTAVRMGSDTASFKQRLVNEGFTARDFCDPLLTPLPGGQPITDLHGSILGGIGISGLKPEEDADLAKAVAGLAEVRA